MLIGEFAAMVGLPGQTIRFYERTGLLPCPRREPNGYRSYDGSTAARVQFIRSAQSAGLTLSEIRGIIELRDHGDAPCSHVASLLDRKLADVHARQRELFALKSDLEHLLQRSRRLQPGDCPETAICHILTVPR